MRKIIEVWLLLSEADRLVQQAEQRRMEAARILREVHAELGTQPASTARSPGITR